LALQKAWDLKPDESRTATLMLSVELGIGGGNRDQMEMWFERAMKADGNNRDACHTKMAWLEPKWYGSIEDVLAFGQACRDTKNWRARLTLLAAVAHVRKAQQLSEQEQSKYLSSPEVWNVIQSVYEEYLAHYPDDNRERSFYAAYCYMCGHYVESDKHFRIVGDNLIWWEGMFPEKWMKQARAFVAHKAKSAEQPPADKPAPLPAKVVESERPAITPQMIKPQPIAVAPPQPAAQSESGGVAGWIWVLFGVGAVLIVGVAIFFFLFSGGSRRDGDRYGEDEEEERPRRKKRRRT
jgi:hypothetical protein